LAKKLAERSDKSREKWADSLMNTGTTIHATAVITFFVTPLTALVTVFLSRGDLPVLTEAKLNSFLLWVQGWALLLFPVAIIFGIWVKNMAMDIYDSLSKKEQAKERRARLTTRSSGTPRKRGAP